MKRWSIITVCALLFLALITIRPVSTCKANAIYTKGVVESIVLNSQSKDLVITLADKRMFYINRALETTINVDHLEKKLPGKMVSIAYPDQWNILYVFANSKHINELSWEKGVVYSEFEDISCR